MSEPLEFWTLQEILDIYNKHGTNSPRGVGVGFHTALNNGLLDYDGSWTEPYIWRVAKNANPVSVAGFSFPKVDPLAALFKTTAPAVPKAAVSREGTPLQGTAEGE